MWQRVVSFILLALCTGSAVAAEPALPATIHLTIHDFHEQPEPGVKVTVWPPASADPAAAISAETDAKGEVTLKVPIPAMQLYSVQMEIVKEGRPTFTEGASIWDDAKVELSCVYAEMRKTTIHVRGADGRPVEGAVLQFSANPAPPAAAPRPIVLKQERYPPDTFSPAPAAITDAHGDFVWEHAAIPQGFQVSVLAADKPIARVETKEADELTVTLRPGTYDALMPTRIMQGKLLLPDGTPAKDWFVAGHVTQGQGAVVTFGGFIESSYSYAADQIAHPAADGTFEIRSPGNFLGLISPEGMQFLYAIDPESWDAQPHRVTFTVPALTGTLQLQMVDSAGKPVAGIPLWPTAMGSSSMQSRLAANWSRGTNAVDDEPWKMVSDQQGAITYPLYAGAHPRQFQIGPTRHDGPFASQITDSVEFNTRIVVKNPPGAAPPPVYTGAHPPLHHLTLRFLDPDGKIVPAFQDIHLTAGLEDRGGGRNADAAGLHLFLPADKMQWELTIPASAYRPVHESITLDGSERQTVTVHLQRGLPVTGRIIDAAGKPAADVGVSMVMSAADFYGNAGGTYRGISGFVSLGLDTSTDADGHFAFANAPDNCQLLTPQGGEPLTITPTQRTFDVRLPANGSVRVLAPNGWEMPPGRDWLTLNSESGNSMDAAAVRWDAASQSFFGGKVPVGRYHLVTDSIPGAGDLTDAAVDVRAGEEAVLDLRRQSPEAGAAPATYEKMTIAVERAGKRVPGVEVAILSYALPPEAVKKYIDVYVHGTNAADKANALKQLQRAAGLALELLAPAGPAPTPLTMEDDLRNELQKGGDALELLASDLSDDGGQMRFEARAGRYCMAVARIRGQWLGMKSFTVAQGNAAREPVVIPLERLRAVTAPLVGTGSPPRSYSFTIVKPEGVAKRVLESALDDDPFWGVSRVDTSGIGRSLGMTARPDGFTFEGLPAGTVISLQPPQLPGTYQVPDPVGPITILPGDGPMDLLAHQQAR